MCFHKVGSLKTGPRFRIEIADPVALPQTFLPPLCVSFAGEMFPTAESTRATPTTHTGVKDTGARIVAAR